MVYLKFDNIAVISNNNNAKRMRIIEQIKVILRANKYKTNTDRGGIAYLHQSIKPGHTVLDIGAHKGGYLYFINKLVGDSGTVVAFEPQSSLYAYLKTLKPMFEWNRTTIEQLALSDTKGKVTLFIPANKHDSSSPGATLVPHAERKDFHTEEVGTETLDNYCKSHQLKPDFLKIDVEGNELNIFKGGMDTLTKYKPKIIVECEERHIGKDKVMETIRFLENLNYSGRFIKDDEYLPLTQFDFAVHQDTSRKPYCNNFIFE
ncbi:MAG: FkbM family methyltransferase [Bacteroidota bacterium]